MTADKSSYRQILRSSSIVGGGHVANYLLSLVRVKIIASLIGPSGVGLVGLYYSAIGLVGVVSGMGIGSSAVREIVRAYSRDDATEAARTVIVLRRACWFTGLFGWALMILFRESISIAMTGTSEHASDIAWLGASILLGAIGAGQSAHLQGLRRLGDMARADVFSALIASFSTVGIYWAVGASGIVPAIIAASVISLGCLYWYGRKIELVSVPVGAKETFEGFRRLGDLGLAFMWSGVLVAGLDSFTRSLITQELGVISAGLYQAAWAVSGIFANFVLMAMGADFYPRLTAVIHDRPAAGRTVNEQTEVGILLALPGLIGAIVFSSLAMRTLYTSEFLSAAELLPWMSLGVFGRVVSWPLGFIQIALGASRWFAATETFFTLIQALMTFVLVKRCGAVGAAYAYTLLYALYTPAMLWVGRRLIDFSWTRDVLKLVAVAVAFVFAALATRSFNSEGASPLLGVALTLAACLFSAHGLVDKLGHGHRLRKLMSPTLGATLSALARRWAAARWRG